MFYYDNPVGSEVEVLFYVLSDNVCVYATLGNGDLFV